MDKDYKANFKRVAEARTNRIIDGLMGSVWRGHIYWCYHKLFKYPDQTAINIINFCRAAF